jgi:glycosyltransferase involved in cell wall biosynthesis
MKKVLLINQDKIPHYRVPVYNRLSEYLKNEGFNVTVVSSGIQEDNPHKIEFNYKKLCLTFLNLSVFILKLNPNSIIFWVNLKCMYLFPTLFLAKLLRKEVIYWGHGLDLLDRKACIKNLAYTLQHWLSDAIILYSDNLKKFVRHSFEHKVFIANNTLNFSHYNPLLFTKSGILEKYNIKTKKNIICMGRMEKRKRIHDLFRAFKLIDLKDIGLILVGPDKDGTLKEIEGENIYKIGPIYGEESLKLLYASDVFCLPGHIGLSIVDAFYCGLPIVTEEVSHAPEIMYLKEGINGFVVPKGDVKQLASKLQLLLGNDVLREKFSREAKKEIITNGHIDIMCNGFSEALKYISQKNLK